MSNLNLFGKKKLPAIFDDMRTREEMIRRGFDPVLQDASTTALEDRLVSSYLKSRYSSIWQRKKKMQGKNINDQDKCGEKLSKTVLNQQSHTDDAIEEKREKKGRMYLMRNKTDSKAIQDERKSNQVMAGNEMPKNEIGSIKQSSLQLLTKIKPYWKESLLTKASKEEILQLDSRILSARKILSIDIYEAKGIVKTFGIATIKDLYHKFTEERIQGSVGHMKNLLRKSVYSDAKADAIFVLLAQLDSCIFHLENDTIFQKANIQQLGMSIAAELTSSLQDEDVRSTVTVKAATNEKSTAVKSGVEKMKIIQRETKASYLESCASLFILPRQRMFDIMTKDRIEFANYGLGKTEWIALSNALMKNSTIVHLNLSNNWLKHQGGLQAVNLVLHLPNLIYLNLSRNKLGPQSTAALLDTLAGNKVLQELHLDDNAINDNVEVLMKQLIETTHIEFLHIGNNNLRNNTIVAVGGAIQKSKRIQDLSMQWSFVAPAACSILSEGLTSNHSLVRVNLSWCSMVSECGFQLATAMLRNRTITDLDVSGNRFPTAVGIMFAEVLLHNHSIQLLNLSRNCIGLAGRQAFQVVELIHDRDIQVNLENMVIGPDVSDAENKYEDFYLVPTRQYQLNLSFPRHRMIAELIRIQVIKQIGIWTGIALNGRKCIISSSWQLPFTGDFDFEYNAGPSIEAENIQVATIQLDLQMEYHRYMAAQFIGSGVSSSPDEIQSLSINGEAIPTMAPDEDFWKKLLGRTDGLVELQLASPEFHCPIRKSFDLSCQSDQDSFLQVLKLLNEAKDNGQPDEIRNMHFNGKSINLTDWEKTQTTLTSPSPRSKWTIPSSGKLDFDYIRRMPAVVDMQHFVFDLSNSTDRRQCHDVYVQTIAFSLCMWKPTINGYPYSFPRDGRRQGIPNKGILELDLLALKGASLAISTTRTPFRLDLSNDKEYMQGELLRRVVLRGALDLTWTRAHVDKSYFPNCSKNLPLHGTLSVDILDCRSRETISLEAHAKIIEQCSERRTEESTIFAVLQLSTTAIPSAVASETSRRKRRHGNRRLVARKSTQTFFTSSMVLEYLSFFTTISYKVDLLLLYFNHIVDNYNMLPTLVELNNNRLMKNLGLPTIKELRETHGAPMPKKSSKLKDASFLVGALAQRRSWYFA